MASGYEKAFDYGGPEPGERLRRVHAYLASWLTGIRLGRWPRYIAQAEFSRAGIVAECQALRPLAVKTVVPETVAALYDNISISMIHLSAELGNRFNITPGADGSVSIQRRPDRTPEGK